MKKTNELIKLPHTTMYFPKITCTKYEIRRMYNGYVPPAWMRMVIINMQDIDDVIATNPKRKSKAETYKLFIEQHINDAQLFQDIETYSRGELDLIDLTVKYGIHYKDLRKLFEQCFPNTDIKTLWKKHKKHVQKRTSQYLYGEDNPAMHAEVRAKKEATMLERYGVTHNMQSPELLEQFKANLLEKHGVQYAFDLNETRDQWYILLFNQLKTPEWIKTLKHIARARGYAYQYDMFQSDKLCIKRRDFSMSYQHTEPMEYLLSQYKEINDRPIQYPDDVLFQLPVDDLFSKVWLRHYGKLGLVDVSEHIYEAYSRFERMVMDTLDAHNITYIRNNRTILNGLEMDFYLPEHNIGIECNPNKTHNSNLYATSSTRVMFGQTKSPHYHYDKYSRARALNIQLVQWFERDLEPHTFNTITFPHFLYKLRGCDERIAARNVNVIPIARIDAQLFIEHYQCCGHICSDEYLGMYHQNELVAVVSLNHNKDCIELTRICFRQGIQIVGGISKFIKTIFRTYPDVYEIITHTNNDIDNGNGYQKAGAVCVGETGPVLTFVSWSDPTDIHQGINLLHDIKTEGQLTTIAEIEKYIELEMPHRTDEKCGYDRIYTSGSKKWSFRR